MGKSNSGEISQVNSDMERNRMEMEMYERQRQSNLEMNQKQLDTQLQIAKMTTEAQTNAANQSAIAGIIGAAMGANKTVTTTKQLLPSEAMAEGIRALDLYEKWNKTREMRESGYSDVAINYELQGKNRKALYSDAQWNAMEMVKLTKKEMIHNASIFGIQSGKNPGGIPLSKEQWIQLNSVKDPSEMLKVDPQVAAQRQAAFDKWERDMRASGNGLIVDLYKNPGLGGTSLLTMKGKDPLIDPALRPLLEGMTKNMNMAPGDPIYSPKVTKTRPAPVASQAERNAAADRLIKQSKGIARVDDASNGRANQMLADAERIRSGSLPIPGFPTSGGTYTEGGNLIGFGPPKKTGPDINLDPLMQGEQTPYRAEIEKHMKTGLIDKYGMVNPGVLLSHIPPELTERPEFNMYKTLDEATRVKLLDQYNQYADMDIDQKLITQTTLGFGVNRRIRLNPDGTIMATALEGTMKDMMGNDVFVSMQGNRLQEYYDRMSMADGMGPSFPAMRAPKTDEEMSARFEPGFWGKNMLAKPGEGPGQPGERAQGEVKMPNLADPYAGAAGSKPAGEKPPANKVASSAPTGAPPTAGTLGKALVNQSVMPIGYEGAPLAAGE